jgi:signal transduction histidine kinase
MTTLSKVKPPDQEARRCERQFVGAVCASLSHEIKNCLAIINENAGLMGDLALMAGQGRPADPERQARIAASVQKQVVRADQLVRNLNRFAHSGDLESRPPELADSIAFVQTLFERTATNSGLRLEAGPIAEAVVDCAPLELLQLLWRLLLAGVERSSGAVLAISAQAAGPQVLIQIEVQSPGAEIQPPPLPDALLDLALALGGTLEQAPAGGSLSLCLPLKGGDSCPGGP